MIVMLQLIPNYGLLQIRFVFGPEVKVLEPVLTGRVEGGVKAEFGSLYIRERLKSTMLVPSI
jgi:hypothetical protein